MNRALMTAPWRPSWWGGRAHIVFTVIVFVMLASLDNAAIALIPNMVLPVSEELNTSKAAIGVITAVVILITGVTAVAWGYWGDRSRRKRLLFVGTAVWAAGAALSATAASYGQLFAWQAVTAVGLGSIASIGYSVISDLVAPLRRGIVMSLWGLAQGGIGVFGGGLLASQLGASDFRRPFVVVAVLGAAFGLLYLATFDAPRGFREPELASLVQSEAGYTHTIATEQLRGLWKTRTNRWLVLQGLTAQLAYGSLIWVPLLYQEKVIAAGYSTEVGTRVGGIFVALFQLGGLFSILAGHIGDRWRARDPAARAKLSTIGILGAIPFFVGFFFIPLRGLDIDPEASTIGLIGGVGSGTVVEPVGSRCFPPRLGRRSAHRRRRPEPPRADLRRQPARASGNRLRPVQPREQHRTGYGDGADGGARRGHRTGDPATTELCRRPGSFPVLLPADGILLLESGRNDSRRRSHSGSYLARARRPAPGALV